jgi:predicted DNA-binding transcriptional regulator YafY
VRSDTAVTIDRIFEMVTVLSAKPLTRADLARRWNVTPRQVSNIVLRARDWCNVTIKHEPGFGYRVIDAGILNPKAGRR